MEGFSLRSEKARHLRCPLAVKAPIPEAGLCSVFLVLVSTLRKTMKSPQG